MGSLVSSTHVVVRPVLERHAVRTMKVTSSLLMLVLVVGSVDVGAPAQTTPTDATTTNAYPLLRQLDGEVKRVYATTADGIVRVRVPTRWLNPTASWLRKWEGRIAPQMRQRLLEQQQRAAAAASAQGERGSTATTAPSTGPTTTSAAPTTGRAGSAPATQPTLAVALFPEMTDVAGLLIDDAGHVLLGGYVDPAQATDPATVRVTARDGASAGAAFVGTDSLSGLTLLRVAPRGVGNERPLGTPVTITNARPAEGSLLVLLHGGGEAKLVVYTAGTRESGIVAMPDGSVGVLREGSFLGGPGYAAILDDLRTRGRACRPQLGLDILETAATPETVRVSRPYVVGRSVLLAHQVLADLPAARAGVLPGDVLIAVDGRGVPDMPTLAAVLTESKGSVPMTIGRDGRQVTVGLQLPDPRVDAPARGR